MEKTNKLLEGVRIQLSAVEGKNPHKERLLRKLYQLINVRNIESLDELFNENTMIPTRRYTRKS